MAFRKRLLTVVLLVLFLAAGGISAWAWLGYEQTRRETERVIVLAVDQAAVPLNQVFDNIKNTFNRLNSLAISNGVDSDSFQQAVTWFSQMPGSNLAIEVLDRDGKTEMGASFFSGELPAPLVRALEKPRAANDIVVTNPYKIYDRWYATAITGLNGGNGGSVIAVTFPVDRFLDLWKALGLPKGSAIALLSPEGALWLRLPFKPALTGKNVSRGPLMKSIRKAGTPSGLTRIVPVNTDAVERYVGWKTLDHFEFMIASGLSLDFVYAQWQQKYVAAILVSAVFALLALSIIVVVARSIQAEVNKRRAAEIDLRQAHNELEQRVDERTEDLRQSEERYRDLYENAPNAYCSISYKNGAILQFNHGLCQLLGFEAEEIESMSVFDLYADTLEGLPKAKQIFENVKSGGLINEPELQMRKKNGDVIWVSISVNPIHDKSGKVVESRTIVTDINKRKLAEEAMKKAKQEADEASQTKSRFLAHMSHELRTPLNAIIGFSDSIRQKTFGEIGNEKYEEYVGNIHESGEHLLDLINDILDVSAIEAGRLELNESAVDIREASSASFRLVNARAEQGDVVLKNELTSDLPRIYADERRIKQILVNLLVNAVKFTPPGGTVTLGGGLDGDGALFLHVSDTGVGIAEDDLPKAIEPFSPLTVSLSGEREGTGLGLNLSRSLVQLHGGQLELESEKDVGTKVIVRLPADRIAAG